VAHATHYGPLMATVQKGRIVKIDAQASDKMPTAMLTEGVLDRTYDKTRVAGAMVRKSYLEWEQSGRKGSNKPELRGKDEWVQVSWDTALGLTAKAILYEVTADWLRQPLSAQLADIDRRLSGELAVGRHCDARALQPLPLLGLPGVTADSEDPAYYDDQWQFRPGRGSRRV